VTRPHLSGRQQTLIRLGFFAVVIVIFAIALHSRWADVKHDIGKFSILDLVAATALGFGNIVVSMMAWRTLLRDLGTRLPVGVAARIFFVGQLGKYLPGSVWTVVAQADLGRDHDVPPRRSVAVSVVAMGISLAAALMLAAFTLPFAAPGAAAHYWWVLLLLPVLVVGLMPRSVSFLTHLLLKVLRREPPDHEFSWFGVLRALAWYISSWLMIGLQVYVLCVALGAPRGGRTLPLAFGGSALAFSAGFIAILVPAGAVVREAVMIAVLSPILKPVPAGVVAVVSRLVATIGDPVWAGVGVLAARPYARSVRDGGKLPEDLAPIVEAHSQTGAKRASHPG
jgi:uncharacterized membrane protein YbhN (UPF0104 family)